MFLWDIFFEGEVELQCEVERRKVLGLLRQNQNENEAEAGCQQKRGGGWLPLACTGGFATRQLPCWRGRGRGSGTHPTTAQPHRSPPPPVAALRRPLRGGRRRRQLRQYSGRRLPRPAPGPGGGLPRPGARGAAPPTPPACGAHSGFFLPLLQAEFLECSTVRYPC